MQMLSWLEQSVAAFHVHQRQQTVSNQHVDLDRTNAYATIFGTYFFPQRLSFWTRLLILVSWSPGLRTNIKSSEFGWNTLFHFRPVENRLVPWNLTSLFFLAPENHHKKSPLAAGMLLLVASQDAFPVGGLDQEGYSYCTFWWSSERHPTHPYTGL